MAIDFTTLTGAKTVTGSISHWVNRSDLPVADILTEAEAYIYQRFRAREMLAQTTLTITAATASVALPSDFLDPLQFIPFEWSYALSYVHEASMNRNRDSAGALFDGTPSSWSAVGTNMLVDVNALANFGGELTYYAQPEALSGTNETNFVTVRYPTMLRRSCLKYAYEHMKDYERMAAEEALAIGAVEEANATNELFRRTQEHTSQRYY